VLVLGVHSSVAALHMLLLFCESFKAEVFFIYVFDLSCNYVNALVIVFVDGGDFVLTILHRSKLFHRCCLVLDRGLTQRETSFHQVISVTKRFCTFKTKSYMFDSLTL